MGFLRKRLPSEIGLEGGASTIEALSESLWKARGKSLVVGGGLSTRTPSAVSLQLAINLLNSALENEGVTVVGSSGASSSEDATSYAGLAALTEEMKSGHVDVLIICGTNPAFTTPRIVTGLEEAIKRVPTVVSIASHADETSRFADFVLPEHHFLENWGDARPYPGFMSLQQPAIAPLYSTRSFEDSLLALSKAAQLKQSEKMNESADWHAYLMASWKEIYQSEHTMGGFEQFWETCLRDGVYTFKSQNAKPSPRSFRTTSLAQAEKFVSSRGSGLTAFDVRVDRDGRWHKRQQPLVTGISGSYFVDHLGQLPECGCFGG